MIGFYIINQLIIDPSLLAIKVDIVHVFWYYLLLSIGFQNVSIHHLLISFLVFDLHFDFLTNFTLNLSIKTPSISIIKSEWYLWLSQFTYERVLMKFHLA